MSQNVFMLAFYLHKLSFCAIDGDFPSLTIYLIKFELIYCFYGKFTQLSLQSSRLLGEKIYLFQRSRCCQIPHTAAS